MLCNFHTFFSLSYSIFQIIILLFHLFFPFSVNNAPSLWRNYSSYYKQMILVTVASQESPPTSWLCAYVLSHFSLVCLFATLWTVALWAFCPWDSPDKNSGVGCRALLGIWLKSKQAEFFLRMFPGRTKGRRASLPS